MLARVTTVGEHEYLENVHGRRARLYPGDVIVGAYGNRYATDFYEGYLPRVDDPVHLLTAGGLIGTVASAYSGRGEPTTLHPLAALVGPAGAHGRDVEAGAGLNTEDVALVSMTPTPAGHASLGASPPTVVVLGSGMNSGKTTTAAAIVRGLSTAGLRVGAGKVTGSGSGKDSWAYLDAGAVEVLDFLDAGMASTFGYPIPRLIATMHALSDRLCAASVAAVVLEIADGLLQPETRALAARLPDFADRIVLTAADALGALAALEVLAGLGVTPNLISGVVTASPLATREAATATGLTVASPAALIHGQAVGLLAGPARDLDADRHQLLRA